MHHRILAFFGLCVLWASSAHAQESGGDVDLDLPSISNYAPATPVAPLADPALAGELLLDAKLTGDGEVLGEGMIWRVYGSTVGPDERLPLIAKASGGPARFTLEPGSYIVHAAFGRAGATTRVTIDGETRRETLVMDAGGLVLDATLPNGAVPRPDRLRFDIHTIEPTTGEYSLVLPDVPAGEMVRVPTGTYHVISKYGRYNAEIRADLRVEAGQTTKASMLHNAAHASFRLVREPGGVPLADTAWSVLNATGEIIMEHGGPDPSAVLAAGIYTVIAENRGRLFQRDVKIAAGKDIEVEVIAEPAQEAVPSDAG